jgi:23S rRNA pseudouridine1911/1915/1917 synthase
VKLQTRKGEGGRRLDHFLQEHFPEQSRSRLQEWIKARRVLVNEQPGKASQLVREGDTIDVEPAPATPLAASPESIPLDILYEDADLIAVNKPAGMVVHAGAGVRSGTLVNALLARFDQLSKTGGDLRPGIVHRLDRYTSGVLLVAKNDAAHRNLAEQFASRRVRKIYTALVHGEVKADQGRIEKPITRDPQRRVRMTARLAHGRAAWSEYRVLQRFAGYTLLEVRIGTGRTHQIRVHLASIGHPVVGDRLYGAPAQPPGRPALDRYFLHAASITFAQPRSGETIELSVPLPPELDQWMQGL